MTLLLFASLSAISDSFSSIMSVSIREEKAFLSVLLVGGSDSFVVGFVLGESVACQTLGESKKLVQDKTPKCGQLQVC